MVQILILFVSVNDLRTLMCWWVGWMVQILILFVSVNDLRTLMCVRMLPVMCMNEHVYMHTRCEGTSVSSCVS